jgi:hypothetical protein
MPQNKPVPASIRGRPVVAPLRRNSEKAEEIIGILSFAGPSEKMPGLFHLFYQVRDQVLRPQSNSSITIANTILWRICQSPEHTNSDPVTKRSKSSSTTQRSKQNVCVTRSARPEADALPRTVKNSDDAACSSRIRRLASS